LTIFHSLSGNFEKKQTLNSANQIVTNTVIQYDRVAYMTGI